MKQPVGQTEMANTSRLLRTAWLLFVFDVAAVAVATMAAILIRFDTLDPAVWLQPYVPTALLPIFVRPVVFLAFGLYRREWRYASLRDVLDIVNAVAIGSLIVAAAHTALAVGGVAGTGAFPRSWFLIEPTLVLGLSGGVRLLIRVSLERQAMRGVHGETPTPTLIYGAGSAGAIVARMAASGALPDIRVVGYLDDDRRKRRSRLMGHRVLGSLEDLAEAVDLTAASQLVVAIPSGPAQPVRRAVSAAQKLHLSVKTVPPLRDLMTGQYGVAGIRSVSVEDLLRRTPVAIDPEAIAASINGASVVVTGGGGSIGSELVRQILSLGPRVLTIVENHEWTLWNVERDISLNRNEADGAHVVAALADVRSRRSLEAVLRRAKPDVVFHAAALKHVPYVELFPSEGVLTNVVGTRNVLQLCEALDVGRFLLISTDKAVEPVSIMGATKRLAEQLTVVTGQRTGRAYAAVRFGNVLGSSGSVVPLLQRQLDDALPLTITQPDATRYFMTISEAVSLVLEAAANPAPGDTYVLDMGKPIRILDLAHDLVRLNGLDPETVTFTVTGLRPGERLHEKLFYDDERAERTDHEGIWRAYRASPAALERELDIWVEQLNVAASERSDQVVREMLRTNERYTGMATAFPSAGIDAVPTP